MGTHIHFSLRVSLRRYSFLMKAKYGKYRYEDGSLYTGQFDTEGRRHGFGKLEFDDEKKSYYEGEFKNGQTEGLGVLKTPYFIMQGQFKQGKLNGVGRSIRCDGLRYEGEFRQGAMCGLGILTFPDGTHGTPPARVSSMGRAWCPGR